MVMHRESRTSMGESSHKTGTPAAAENRGNRAARRCRRQERERCFLQLGGAAESSAELIRFDLAEDSSPRRSKICGIGRRQTPRCGHRDRQSARRVGERGACQSWFCGTKNRQGPEWDARLRPRKGDVVVTRWSREKLVALQNANCTTVGGEFDFREPCPRCRRAPW